jgi:hypothetical protein
MAISGRATIKLPRGRGEVFAFSRALRFDPATRLLACGLVAIVLAGCAAPSFRMGKTPAVEKLSQLAVGSSTTKDVMTVLGEPQGRGATRSTSYGLKDAWLYEITETSGTRASVRMLMIFLDKETGVYHGHMWMAAGLLMGQTKQ